MRKATSGIQSAARHAAEKYQNPRSISRSARTIVAMRSGVRAHGKDRGNSAHRSAPVMSAKRTRSMSHKRYALASEAQRLFNLLCIVLSTGVVVGASVAFSSLEGDELVDTTIGCFTGVEEVEGTADFGFAGAIAGDTDADCTGPDPTVA